VSFFFTQNKFGAASARYCRYQSFRFHYAVLDIQPPLDLSLVGCGQKGSGFGKMTALPQVEGVCGMCSRQLRRMRGMIGRRVEDMEEPLRQAVHGQTLVCDECLQSVQPVSRATGPSWACTRWAQRQSTSSPLCARNGWNCNNQKSETEAGRTKVLKLCRLFGSANPEYYLRKYEIPPWVCRLHRRALGSAEALEPSEGFHATPVVLVWEGRGSLLLAELLRLRSQIRFSANNGSPMRAVFWGV